MNIQQVALEWPIAGVSHIAPLTGGINNHVWRIDAIDGHEYVLRIGSQKNHASHIRYESLILQILSQHALPFKTPIFLPNRQGNIVQSVELDDHTLGYAVLAPLLQGMMPTDRTDLVLAANAGTALALLDNTFASFEEIVTQEVSMPMFGELSLWHPLVPDPLAAIERLPIEHDHIQQIQHILTQVIEQYPAIYAQSPKQIVHRDFDASNILVDQQRITAALDFEFAGNDIRILDLCVALSWWPFSLFGTGQEWSVMDAFGMAYVAVLPLAIEELLLLPAAFRLRDVTSLVYRIGRYFAGLETTTQIQHRIQHSLWREKWLSANTAMLQEHARMWHNNR